MSITILDGGMGQELLRRSKREATPLWSADVMLNEPHLVQDLHREFIESGARVITLNTYTATPQRLERDGALQHFERLHKSAIHAAQEAVKSLGVAGVQIAGCLPPLVASFRPETSPSFEESVEGYRQIVNVQSTDCDLFICETMSSINEARAACTAAMESQKPVWVSFSVNDNTTPAQLRSGELLSDAVKEIGTFGVDAILLNCCHPEIIDNSWEYLQALGIPTGAYANAFKSVEPLKPGGTVNDLQARNDMSPEKYAQHALKWVEMGATIIGGCCEIGPKHIELLHQKFSELGMLD
ncbi:MAG: homocysteine S-methyltransferase family protein [Micavibrio sp.]|nr:homocysteine S-methyltransferase family protein [Micavibrio sp.]